MCYLKHDGFVANTIWNLFFRGETNRKILSTICSFAIKTMPEVIFFTSNSLIFSDRGSCANPFMGRQINEKSCTKIVAKVRGVWWKR